MAGGDYVSPVQATVLALTAKRVKIEADDDGEIVNSACVQRACSVRDDHTTLVPRGLPACCCGEHAEGIMVPLSTSQSVMP